jgi:hypothetical protein
VVDQTLESTNGVNTFLCTVAKFCLDSSIVESELEIIEGVKELPLLQQVIAVSSESVLELEFNFAKANEGFLLYKPIYLFIISRYKPSSPGDM